METYIVISIIFGIVVVGILSFCIGRSFPKSQRNDSNEIQKHETAIPVTVNYSSREERKMNGQSALRRAVTVEKFKAAYTNFMIQADRNAVSLKGNGSRTPYGFETNRDFDGARISQHFGQGAASMTPYLNWWVVSIYYITSTRMIVMGIEEDRYPHINKMKPLRYERIGNKNTRVAVFYSTPKANINWEELQAAFIRVSEEVMRLGLR